MVCRSHNNHNNMYYDECTLSGTRLVSKRHLSTIKHWVDCRNVIATANSESHVQETHYRSTLISPITSPRNQLVTVALPTCSMPAIRSLLAGGYPLVVVTGHRVQCTNRQSAIDKLLSTIKALLLLINEEGGAAVNWKKCDSLHLLLLLFAYTPLNQ